AAGIQDWVGRTVPLLVIVPSLRRRPGLVTAVVFPGSQRAIALIFVRRKELACEVRVDKEEAMLAKIIGHDAAANLRHGDQVHELVGEPPRSPSAEGDRSGIQCARNAHGFTSAGVAKSSAM